jgi:dihydroorotate dehydrogenase
MLRDDHFGLLFEHPLGLAAGLDRDGEAINLWGALGFSFIELGTVTRRPIAPGADPGGLPAVLRLPKERGLWHRLDPENAGVDALVERLQGRTAGAEALPIGVSIGASNTTTPIEDYEACLRLLGPRVDYVVVNLARASGKVLKMAETLIAIVTALAEVAEEIRAVHKRQRPIPILVKIGPDLTHPEVDALAELAPGVVHGIVATDALVRYPHSIGAPPGGGLSGPILKERAQVITRRLFRKTGGTVPIIGVGGLESADDIYRRIRAGAALVQVYTALIYEGPTLIRRLVHGLKARLERGDFSHIRDAVGSDA